jgi:hypothetical protein
VPSLGETRAVPELLNPACKTVELRFSAASMDPSRGFEPGFNPAPPPATELLIVRLLGLRLWSSLFSLLRFDLPIGLQFFVCIRGPAGFPVGGL